LVGYTYHQRFLIYFMLYGIANINLFHHNRLKQIAYTFFYELHKLVKKKLTSIMREIELRVLIQRSHGGA